MRLFNVKVKFPKKDYQELKQEAAKKKLSFSAFVREKVASKIKSNQT